MTALNTPVVVCPIPWGQPQVTPAAVDLTMDATGEYQDFIGYVYWDGEAASKTVSSAGGKVVWRTGSAVTFANTGTDFTIGIQDVDTASGPPGRGDGTDDVSVLLEPGTETVAATTTYETAFESGSKTISHGQLVAIRFIMTARAGADSVTLNGFVSNAEGNSAYVANNVGGSAAVNADIRPNAMIIADDGTYGWLLWAGFFESVTANTFDSGHASADEYATLVQFTIGVDICGVQWYGRHSTATGTSKAIIYTDPTGTPASAKEKTVTCRTVNGTATSARGINTIMFDSALTVAANTKIAIALQPQDTSADIELYEVSHGSTSSGAAKSWRALGGTWTKGTRLNASGAFTETTTVVPCIWPIISAIATAGGTTIAGTPMRRGMV